MSAGREGRGRTARRGGRSTASPPVDLARERRIRGKLAELTALLESGAVDGERTRAMLAGELPTMSTKDAATTLRLPAELLTRVDKLAERLAGPDGKASRSAALRVALERGIASLEADGDKPGELTPAEVLADLDALRARVKALAATPTETPDDDRR